MSTASFDRSFDIRDTESAARLNQDLHSPRTIKVVKRDYATDDDKGVKLLKQRFSGYQQR